MNGHHLNAIQAFTKTCTGCHGSRTNSEADLKDYEIEANQSVIPTNLLPKTGQ